MTEAYEPAPKDRKQMTDAELLQEFPGIGFEYLGIIQQNGPTSDLSVKVTRGSSRYLIPTTTPNTGIAIQEALFNLTNNVIVQQNEHWLQQHRTMHPLLEKAYLCLFPLADYVKRLFI